MKTSAILVASVIAGAAAHGTLKYPTGPSSMTGGGWLEGKEIHWYSQGSMIGCLGSSLGNNCNAAAPCCASPMEPTITDPSHLSFTDLSIDTPVETTGRGHRFNGPPPDPVAGRGPGPVAGRGPGPVAGRGPAPVAGRDPNLRGRKGHGHKGHISGDEKLNHKGKRVAVEPYIFNPWYAPGHAPVGNPCGVLGGWRYSSTRDYVAGPGDAFDLFMSGKGGPTNAISPPVGMSPPAGTTGTAALLQDINTRMQDAQGEEYRTNDNSAWKAGTSVNVSYQIIANHGGGIQYRLCKLDHLFDGTMNEDCFQRMPLDFVGNTSWFEHDNNDVDDADVNSSSSSSSSGRSSGSSSSITSIPFTPIRVSDSNSKGVLPAGSTWTKVGISACTGVSGGAGMSHCDTPQFENELTQAGLWGFGNFVQITDSGAGELKDSGNTAAFKKVLQDYSIVDTVKVPEGIEGDYVLSWRWDSEQTSQVWTQCSVVTVEA